MDGNQPGEGGGGEAAPAQRWTCEACGCNTNTQSDSTCSVCGTSNSGPAGLRRGQGRPGWFHRSVFGRGARGLPEEFGMDDDADLWESVVDDVDMGGGSGAGDAVESLAAEVSSAARRSLDSRRQGLESSRQRLLDAARAFSQQPSRSSSSQQGVPSSEELMQAATRNSSHYNPQWANPTQLASGRGTRSPSSIELVPGQTLQQLAHVPPGAGEGRAIRSNNPVPRESALMAATRSSPRRQSASSQQAEETGDSNNAEIPGAPRRTFGFRVAFDHPGCETGGNLGGCYLVGITVASFNAYGEQNALSQSGFFWGIEDGGNKYEGARYAQPNRGSRRMAATYGTEVNSADVPMNESSALFGSKEVVTVVVELASRTMSFWRNDTFLGTLITNLPRSGNLYPVAVPFNSGVAVAITGLDGDPLPLLENFSADAKRMQKEKEASVRREVAERRERMFRDGTVTQELTDVLSQLFALYKDNDDEETLSFSKSARLFYRCGMKLDFLDSFLKDNNTQGLSFQHFLGIIQKVLQEDAEKIAGAEDSDDESLIKTGDRVELCDGYSKFEDASTGPLKPGDRGTVVEIQSGPNGERRSVRVLYNGRRWWYQKEAVVSDRSGLIDSSGIWFISTLLRSHGFDHTTLRDLKGKPFDVSISQAGDVVAPAERDMSSDSTEFGPCIARVVPDSPSSPSTTPTSDSTSVTVEFVNPSFATSAGTPGRSMASAGSPGHIDRRKVRANKLQFSAFIHVNEGPVDKMDEDNDVGFAPDQDDASDDSSGNDMTTEKVRSDLSGVSRLQVQEIENIRKECQKSPEALAAIFSAGLPDTLLAASDVAKRQMNSLEPREDLPERISSLSSLTLFLADQLFSGSPKKYSEGSPERVFEDGSQLRERGGDNLPVRSSQGANSSATSSRRSANNNSLVASIQQRRSFLLSLMSRGARPQGGLGAAIEAAAMGNRDFNFGSLPPHAFGSTGGDGSPPDNRGENNPNAVAEQWDFAMNVASQESSGAAAGAAGTEERPSVGAEEESFLDLIRRRRGFVSSKSRARASGMSQLVFQHRVFELGLLTNSMAWTRSLVEDFGAKNSMKVSSLLRYASDEEGKSPLFLALSFGCSADIINYLLDSGAQVSSEDIKRCIGVNRHDVLAVLLRHGSVPDEIDVSNLSKELSDVVVGAKRRQDSMERKMRETAGSFMVSILRKLIKLALQARRHRSPRLDICSRVISEMLVGNLLLQVVKDGQKDTADSANSSSEDVEAGTSRDESLSLAHPTGLLNALPANILAQALFSDVEHATDFFLVLEDYLCSKELVYAAAGLTALVSALRHFPQLRSCSEMTRYGMLGLSQFHDELASNRCAEILSRQLRKTVVGESKDDSQEDGDGDLQMGSDQQENPSAAFVVFCPQKHKAHLHVTRHSSFRCDVCGCGVERGRVMVGCRECDWDACEDCCDKAESGLLKCNAIRSLASESKKLLSPSPDEGASPPEEDLNIASTLEELKKVSGSVDLESISAALVEHDSNALQELSRLVRTPGRISINQFQTTILPSLHGACLGPSTDSTSGQGGHKSKKAKVGTFFSDEQESKSLSSPSKRSQFCKQIVNTLILDNGEKQEKLDTPKESSNDDNDEEDDKAHEEEAPGVSLLSVDTEPVINEKEIGFYAESSELLRRLQQILSMHESVSSPRSLQPKRKPSSNGNPTGCDLQILTSPLELELVPSSFGEPIPCARNRLLLRAEPLLPLSNLELHVLRASVPLHAGYLTFCQSLVSDKAVILERKKSNNSGWKLAQVQSYDEASGTHSILYASGFTGGKTRAKLQLNQNTEITELVCFEQEISRLALAAREFVVVHRDKNVKTQSISRSPVVTDGSPHVGSRAESDVRENGLFEPFTVVKCENTCCTLVSDEGVAFSDVEIGSVRFPGTGSSSSDSGTEEVAIRSGEANTRGDSLARAFPFFAAARSRSEESKIDASQRKNERTALKRSWSALSLVDTLAPFELSRSRSSAPDDKNKVAASFICKIGESEIEITPDLSLIEMPPTLEVRFNIHEKLPGVEFGETKEITLARALQIIHERRQDCKDFVLSGKHKLFYTVSLVRDTSLTDVPFDKPVTSEKSTEEATSDSLTLMELSKLEPTRRTRQLSSQSQQPEENDGGLCDGLDDVCLRCMEVVDVLASASGYSSTPRDRHTKGSAFANESISKKLVAHLEDPMAVVGGILPEWCLKAPSFAPRVVTYEARKALLDSAAFGVSRSTFKQQEQKINVGKLRHRMASLRGRAVELVGEAFSGGAEDPTALQLQADELYGMEEALASRVRAMFRAAGWQEYSLQVAKAAVRRDNLLEDATHLMQQYSSDPRVNRRRLEVRFDGESGFDAASGDEAGVTRGFYADVAEALLSSETVAGVQTSSLCSQEAVKVAVAVSSNQNQPMEIDDLTVQDPKLPLWIPDMDSGSVVVIPTPRADERSYPGIFPRPLPSYHPQIDEICKRFRFMGRLFASAMRDNFMFPLPLSKSFLKLVQHGARSSEKTDVVLTSSDLPRPGFLGGDVYAAEAHICRALDKLDAADPPLPRPELLRKYSELASDRNFARVAFGKTYDCSFDEYFVDKTFVDPLDPAQDENAAPLCPKGAQKNITVFNVREWVDLARRFFLHDGVVAQAEAFRKGVEDFFPSHYLLLFTADELQHDVCGVGDNVENWDESAVRKIFKLDGGKGAAEALVAVAAIGGEGGAALSRRFGPSSPTISYLVKALLEGTPQQRRQFLCFVTSVPIVTPGRIEVVPIVSPSGDFLPMNDPGCLPRANTCARRLYLPKFDDYETFASTLWAVVREESKFKGFYEWKSA